MQNKKAAHEPSVREIDKPLITFALFAYNQEAFIREAIEGAFAQDYQPLEIILSDDASTDGTFRVIEEMAASYVGPHTVKILRAETNAGLISHINKVVEHVSSDFIVMAAGDDISLPWRVSSISEVLGRDKTVAAVFSECIEFSGDSKRLMPRCPEGFVATQTPLIEILMNAGGVGIGATYAYHKKCFIWPDVLPGNIHSEDRILPLRAALFGRVCKIESPLLNYRKTEGSLTSVLIQSKRLSHQDHGHWSEIKNTLTGATRPGLAGLVYTVLLRRVVDIRMFALKLDGLAERSKSGIYRAVSFLIMLPLRAMRKFSERRKIHVT